MEFDKKYLDLFGIKESDLREVLSIALARGGEYADLYFEYTVSNELSLRDGEVNAVSSNIDYGVGIRVVSGDKTGFAFTEQTTLAEMKNAARIAAQIATLPDSVTNIPAAFTPIKGANYSPIISPWEDHSVTEKMGWLTSLNEKVFAKDSRITKVLERLTDSNTKILFYNSLGESFTDERPMAALVVTCVMEENGRIESSSSSRSFRMGYEFINEPLLDEMAQEAYEKGVILFQASQPKGGEMPVVMGAGGSGILLHEAIGHAFEADFNRKGTSIFSDKLGKQICDKSINIVDDGTLMHNRGSVNIDDEGIPGQKTYMVKDGILNSYLHDRISAKFYNTASTGNGRRESFRFMPIPRMRATYMENGNCREADLIAEVKKGIYVDNFSNGQVQIGAGDFTFYVKSGYLIENGKLTTPIKDINIIGNGPEALADIIGVAENNRIDNGTWTCGKEQYCPVSCGMPSVLIKQLTVGGVN